MLKNKFGFRFVFMLGILLCAGLGASEKPTPPSRDIHLQHKQQLLKIARLLPEKARTFLPPDLWIYDEIQETSKVMSGNGAISGQVAKAAGGGGIAGVIIRAHLCECPSYSNYDTTDASGNYIIPNLPAGKYTVWTDNDSTFVDVYFNDKPSQDADTVIVTSDGTTDNINFSLHVGAIITGKLTLPGAPYVMINVEAIDTLTNEYYYAQPFSIGDTATYAVKRLPTGKYKIRTYDMFMGYIDEYYNNRSSWASADLISVTEGNTYGPYNITLDVGATIEGTVSGSGPLEDIMLWAHFVDDRFEWIHMGYTDASGDYSITGLRSGNWKVFCYGDTLYAWEWYNNADSWNSAASVSVTAPNTIIGKDFSLEVGGSISGYVYGEGTSPLTGADVVALDTSFASVGLAMKWDETSANGSYIITGLRTCDYYVEASTECDLQYYDHKSNIEKADLVSVTMPGNVPDINFNLPSFLRGDVNKDGTIDVGDIVYLINYLFKNGPVPDPFESGDTNCDENLDVGDIVVLINYLFKGGAAPSC